MQSLQKAINVHSTSKMGQFVTIKYKHFMIFWPTRILSIIYIFSFKGLGIICNRSCVTLGTEKKMCIFPHILAHNAWTTRQKWYKFGSLWAEIILLSNESYFRIICIILCYKIPERVNRQPMSHFWLIIFQIAQAYWEVFNIKGSKKTKSPNTKLCCFN